MGFLDYLLGGAAGGLEGYQTSQERQRKAQQEEEDRQIRQLALLNQLGFRPTGLARQAPDVAAQNIVSDISATVPKPTLDTTMGRTFEAAQKRGLGVKPTVPESFGAAQQKAFQASRERAFNVTPEMGAIVRPELPETPLRQAMAAAEAPATQRKPLLDSSRLGQFERAAAMQAANPEMQLDVKGIGRLGFERPLSEQEKTDLELKKYEAQQDLLQKREEAKNDRTNRGIFTLLQKEGQFPKGTTYEDAKALGNLEPYLKDYLAGQSQAAAFQRALTQVGAQSQMGTYVQGTGAEGEPTQIYFGTRGGQLTPTGVQAPAKANAKAQEILNNTKPPSQDDINFLMEFMPTPIRDSKGNITGYTPAKRAPSPAQAFAGRLSGRQGVVGEAGYLASGEDLARLNNILNRTADLQAAKEEPGRLSEGDITRKRDQVNIRTGDVGRPALTYQKLSTARNWMNAMQGGAAQGTSISGDDLLSAFPDRATQIQKARAAGYSDAKIRQKLTGGR